MMINQRLNLIEVEKACQKAMVALKAGLMDQYDQAATELVELIRVKNRKHWWQLWKPKYYYPQLEGVFDLEVDIARSIPKQGRVIKAKTAPEYEPGLSNKGGRVVRHIPKQLKKMKEAQSEVPTVQD